MAGLEDPGEGPGGGWDGGGGGSEGVGGQAGKGEGFSRDFLERCIDEFFHEVLVVCEFGRGLQLLEASP